MIYWTLDQAETSLNTALDTAAPAFILFGGPLTTIDKIVCRSLDIVEERVPQINLPPQMVSLQFSIVTRYFAMSLITDLFQY